MTTRTIARRAALAGAALTAVLALAACGSTDHGSPGHSGPAADATTGAPASGAATFGDADVMFAQMMIPHHRQAVEMSELAETRAADPEVKRLAAQIKAAQAPEIATMTGWLTAWGRPVPPHGSGHGMPEMDHEMPGMMSDAEMSGLAGAGGVEFDRRFLTMMVAHHEGAISMAKEELAKGANADAKAMAQQIVSSQQGEIDQMRKILARL
ncbi:DUF305 domain-containing protein [Micromonospora okii]|uniref:DUF305 domain-containing protein n=1 Tax=Micromonospora okii TaxID=1182970 RepID=UPI001E58423B|nr:DUF305 domain-containing protein [Micromonospora okii]